MDETRRARFEMLMKETREEIDVIEQEVEKELAKVKDRLAALQSEKDAQLTIYDGYCRLLGVENDLAAEEDADE